MKLLPDWIYWIIIAFMALAVGAERVQVANAKATLATEQKARADETIARQGLVITHGNQLRELESQHAASQQQKEEANAKRILDLQTAGAADRATAKRVSSQLAAFTSGAARPGETDAIASQRAKDRLQIVGSLLGEGIGLEAESRELIRQRDAEVDLLLGQIKIDREACSPPVK